MHKSKPLLLISFSVIFIFILLSIWLDSASWSAFRADLKQRILNELTCIYAPPAGVKVDAIYVLGGNQRSLEQKYKTAAELFHQGISNKVWILSRPGITEFNRSVGRNLTNDEWSIQKLEEFGVPEENVEAIKIKEGFFGTFSEAQGISSQLKSRKYKSIVLISSSYHTYRVKISFENFLQEQTAAVYTQASGEKILLRHATAEFIKLKVYQYFLIKNYQKKT